MTLMAVLHRFCQPDDPKALVMNPEIQPKHRTKPSALFEIGRRASVRFASIVLVPPVLMTVLTLE
jgi:hypothetical protein